MKLKMSENSLFAILLRSPWWISIVIAAALSLVMSAIVPRGFSAYGASAGFPFLVIGIIAAWKQLRAPSAAQVARTVETVNAMSWRDFSDALERAFRRDGHEVSRRSGPADFRIVKADHTSVVCAKRWKAASTGIEPLRELHAEAEACGAQGSVYICTGTLTENAQRFAGEKKILVMQGTELARLLKDLLS